MRYPRVRLTALATLALALGVTACATSSRGSGSGRGQSDVVAAEELEKWANEDLFTLIQRIRPTWLQSRATYTGMGRLPISVILDGVLQGSGFDALRGFRAGDALEVRRLNARDATTRFGTDMTAGAIVVVTKH